MIDAIWTTVIKTFHDRYNRLQLSTTLANTPYTKFQDRLRNSRQYKVFESGQGVYQVENPDSGKKSVVKLQEKTCTYRGFYKYQSPCAHAIIACQ